MVGWKKAMVKFTNSVFANPDRNCSLSKLYDWSTLGGGGAKLFYPYSFINTLKWGTTPQPAGKLWNFHMRQKTSKLARKFIYLFYYFLKMLKGVKFYGNRAVLRVLGMFSLCKCIYLHQRLSYFYDQRNNFLRLNSLRRLNAICVQPKLLFAVYSLKALL